ncbi:MAG: phosphatase PAP2 family protein [bacterium]
MTTSKKNIYAPYLLVTVLALAIATLVYPHDASIFRALQSFSSWAGKFHLIREILELFRPFGQGDVILLIAAGIGLCGARRRALHIMLALAVMAILIWPIKIGVGRERPAFKNFQSFPSGDAATATAFVTPLASLSPWMLPAAALVTGGVAMERMYYGRHYASDVLTGAGLGVLSGAIAMAILRRWRWRPPRSWFAMAGLLIVSVALISLLRTRGAPYLLNVLRIWGPLGAFLILTRLIPVWARKRRAFTQLPRQALSAGTTGTRWALITCITGNCVLILTPWFMPIFGLRIPLAVIGLISLFMGHTLLRLRRKCPEAITAIALAGATCVVLSAWISLLPAIHAYRASALTF